MQTFFEELIKHMDDTLEVEGVRLDERLEEYTLLVPLKNLLEVAGYLKHSAKFLQLIDITAVDYLAQYKYFEVVYHCLNMHKNARIRIKIQVFPNTKVPSLCKLYKAANWYEREVFDMFGIEFSDHPNLTRILTDYTFEAFPLRKDFPTEGRFEVHFDEENQCVVYDPVNLPQARRHFDFMVNKWHSPVYENTNELNKNNKT